MPRKTKDLNEINIENKIVEKSTTKAPSKKTKTKPKSSVTKSTSKKSTTNKTKSSSKTAKAKSSKTTRVSKSTAPKKTATKSASNSKKTTRTKKSTKPTVLEYYDLPYRYNQTIVKILAQTPTTLFVYWDISDDDRKKYIDEFGENFFNDTYPVLIIHNKTMNYSFEIEINDFANSWYFNVNDAKCDYDIELGRRAKQNQTTTQLPYNYQYVTSSNAIEAPNDHILFEKSQKLLFFRNVKTNAVIQKDSSSFAFMKYMGKAQNIYNIYKKIYKEDEFQDIQNPSSSFKI